MTAKTITVRVKPRSRESTFTALDDGGFEARLKSPPVDGKANAYLLKFLADAFDVACVQVELLTGDSARQKTVLIRAPKKLPKELGIPPA